jgi:predicted nucleic acid-binding protein
LSATIPHARCRNHGRRHTRFGHAHRDIEAEEPDRRRQFRCVFEIARAIRILGVHRFEVRRGLAEKKAFREVAQFEVFCSHSLLFEITDAILDRACDLWVIARQGGHPHGDADLIIAATALEHGRTLVTGNTSHFAWIPGLKLAN